MPPCGGFSKTPKLWTHPNQLNQLQTMVAFSICSKHKYWDKYLQQFQFSPCRKEVQLNPEGPPDVLLYPWELPPDIPIYKGEQLAAKILISFVSRKLTTAQNQQMNNSDKHHCKMDFHGLDRGWVYAHPLSKPEGFSLQNWLRLTQECEDRIMKIF